MELTADGQNHDISRRALFTGFFGNMTDRPAQNPLEFKDNSDNSHAAIVARELEQMGITDCRAKVRFLPGDHILSPTLLEHLDGVTALTGELRVDALLLLNALSEREKDKKPRGQVENHDNPFKGVVANLLHPGIEIMGSKRLGTMLDAYKALVKAGVRLYPGDISGESASNIMNKDALETVDMLGVGAAGLMVLTELGLIREAVATVRQDAQLTRRDLLKMTGVASLGLVIGSVLKKLAIPNFDDIPVQRVPLFEGANEAEESLEQALRNAGITESELDVFTEVFVKHRNNVMALHTWRAIAEEARMTESPDIATFYGAAHGKTEDIFDKGPSHIEANIEASAERLINDGLTYLIDQGYDNDLIIHLMTQDAELYPPCVKFGHDADEIVRDVSDMPRSAEMIFFGVLQHALEEARQAQDTRRSTILQSVMATFIYSVHQRVQVERLSSDLGDVDESEIVGDLDERDVLYRAFVRPDENLNISPESYMYPDHQFVTVEDGLMQVGIYNDAYNIYPLVLRAVTTDSDDLVLREEAVVSHGNKVGKEFSCSKIENDDLPPGYQVVLVADRAEGVYSLKRQIIYCAPNDNTIFQDYVAYHVEGNITGIDNPVILWQKPKK